MFWKLVTLLGIALAVWSTVRRFLPAAGSPPAVPRRGEVEDLERCPRCGAWNPAGKTCACRLPPTP